MTLKDFVLSWMLTMGLEDANLTFQIAHLDNPVRAIAHGQTQCDAWDDHYQCVVSIDPARLENARKLGKFKAWENTVVHELCHVRVFVDAYEKFLDTRDIRVLHYKHHGMRWRQCARKYRVHFNKAEIR